MKQDFTKFTCDNCGKVETENKGVGFPYAKGWCYIHNFTGKVLKSYTPAIEVDVARFEEKDRHFCKEKCMLKHMIKIIKDSKKWEKEEENPEEVANLINEIKLDEEKE